MNNKAVLSRLTIAVLGVALSGTCSVTLAQDHGHDDQHRPDQSQHHNDSHGNDNHNDNHGRPDYHFQGNDRAAFQQHYGRDANRWRNRRNRPHFSAGQSIPRNYAIRPVPSSYYRGVPPPPPGYRFGYYDGYVVSYNPATRIIADVLDLATGN
jgi:Ni/Co efflux regulator RcnB